MYITSHGLNC